MGTTRSTISPWLMMSPTMVERSASRVFAISTMRSRAWPMFSPLRQHTATKGIVVSSICDAAFVSTGNRSILLNTRRVLAPRTLSSSSRALSASSNSANGAHHNGKVDLGHDCLGAVHPHIPKVSGVVDTGGIVDIDRPDAMDLHGLAHRVGGSACHGRYDGHALTGQGIDEGRLAGVTLSEDAYMQPVGYWRGVHFLYPIMRILSAETSSSYSWPVRTFSSMTISLRVLLSRCTI